jgi:tryptophan 2,3-dioxygenase
MTPPAHRATRASAYATYLDLDLLFMAQGEMDVLGHPDELQFRTVHLVSELWMRLLEAEVGRAIAAIDADQLAAGRALLARAVRIGTLLVDQLGLLETMTPADYHAFRVFLGKASGIQSPGFAALKQVSEPLWRAFQAALGRRTTDLLGVYEAATDDDLAPLHDLAEALVDLDSVFGRFRHGHYQIARRFLGENTAGTGGQGLEYLRRSLDKTLFPDLWRVRSAIAARAGAQAYGVQDEKSKEVTPAGDAQH